MTLAFLPCQLLCSMAVLHARVQPNKSKLLPPRPLSVVTLLPWDLESLLARAGGGSTAREGLPVPREGQQCQGTGPLGQHCRRRDAGRPPGSALCARHQPAHFHLSTVQMGPPCGGPRRGCPALQVRRLPMISNHIPGSTVQVLLLTHLAPCKMVLELLLLSRGGEDLKGSQTLSRVCHRGRLLDSTREASSLMSKP